MSTLPDYKGFHITVSSDGQFIGKTGEGQEGEEVSAYSFNVLKEKIDNISKKQMRMSVYIKSYTGIEGGTLTSVKQTKHGYGHEYQARVSVGGRWREEHEASVFPVTEENTVLAKEFIELENQAQALHLRAEAVSKRMKPINIKELLLK